MELYKPDFKTVASGDSIYFDGSASSTNEAIISTISGNFDARIFIERSNDGGTSWTECTQLADADGSNNFTAQWHTQGNREMLSVGNRRIRIDNVDTVSGEVEAIGDEI